MIFVLYTPTFTCFTIMSLYIFSKFSVILFAYSFASVSVSRFRSQASWSSSSNQPFTSILNG